MWTILGIVLFVICIPVILLILFGIASIMFDNDDDLLGD